LKERKKENKGETKRKEKITGEQVKKKTICDMYTERSQEI
jgi:hypothetical protein